MPEATLFIKTFSKVNGLEAQRGVPELTIVPFLAAISAFTI